MTASEFDSLVSGCVSPTDMKLRSSPRTQNDDSTSSSRKDVKSLNTGRSRRKDWSLKGVQGEVPPSETVNDLALTSSSDCLGREEFVDENLGKQELTDDKSWKAIEKGLFEKGVEIFGRNSCLIARNLLNDLKTCWEVFQYMTGTDNKLACHSANGVLSLLEGCSKYDLNGAIGNNEVRRRSRFLRRRGRVRRLKYTWKSAAYHSIRKRITEKKDQPCRQYNPCSCQTAFARIDLEVVIVLKVDAEAVSVHVLLQTGNVIQMFVEIVGSVVVMALVVLGFHHKEVTIMNAEI
ncbi:SET domain-containing protein isoform 1 [Hibiscus syriacus]|uniref:SET domain-containing protein isoform 1 n=1 Tax=Hibiscus syriacus TaxID=106335 RepID=A0A6A2XVK0_HIBSY|nr:SET domain-containing protein isoform 1 [Hibiscus syriacus]